MSLTDELPFCLEAVVYTHHHSLYMYTCMPLRDLAIISTLTVTTRIQNSPNLSPLMDGCMIPLVAPIQTVSTVRSSNAPVFFIHLAAGFKTIFILVSLMGLGLFIHTN